MEHGVEPLRQIGARRHFVGHPRVADLGFRADDALRDRRRRREERTGDLLGGQSADFAQRQRHLRIGRNCRMAAGEDQPQAVVFDALVVRLRLIF